MAKSCSVDGCDRPVRAWGWCQGHYRRWRVAGDVGADVPFADRTGGECSVDGCTRKVCARRLCNAHYTRLVKHGDVLHNGRTERDLVNRRDKDGYHVIWDAGRKRQVLVHRLVVEDAIGRPLLPSENVHHINGVRDDNRLENLELWDTSHPQGQRIEDKVAWALELLARYPDVTARLRK